MRESGRRGRGGERRGEKRRGAPPSKALSSLELLAGGDAAAVLHRRGGSARDRAHLPRGVATERAEPRLSRDLGEDGERERAQAPRRRLRAEPRLLAGGGTGMELPRVPEARDEPVVRGIEERGLVLGVFRKAALRRGQATDLAE